jgi:hypothetical protein
MRKRILTVLLASLFTSLLATAQRQESGPCSRNGSSDKKPLKYVVVRQAVVDRGSQLPTLIFYPANTSKTLTMRLCALHVWQGSKTEGMKLLRGNKTSALDPSRRPTSNPTSILEFMLPRDCDRIPAPDGCPLPTKPEPEPEPNPKQKREIPPPEDCKILGNCPPEDCKILGNCPPEGNQPGDNQSTGSTQSNAPATAINTGNPTLPQVPPNARFTVQSIVVDQVRTVPEPKPGSPSGPTGSTGKTLSKQPLGPKNHPLLLAGGKPVTIQPNSIAQVSVAFQGSVDQELYIHAVVSYTLHLKDPKTTTKYYYATLDSFLIGR